MEYFLVLHKDEPLTLVYQLVDTYIPEAGGMENDQEIDFSENWQPNLCSLVERYKKQIYVGPTG